MTAEKRKFRIGPNVFTLVLLTLVLLVSGCSSTNTGEPEATTPTPTPTVSITPSPTMKPTAEPTKTPTEGNETSSIIPEGVSIKKVIKEVKENNYHKKIELLTDGGKLETITDANGNTVLVEIEYDGVIKSVDGDLVTVQVDKGEEKTITIPSNVIIEDEDNLGLKSGVEIEWVINAKGEIESVELED